ncbi:uncharacterized protein MYCGRDRAFT_93766 [Zymoseptoria tritici IPO323]|uniref:Uncharacterized protein n=1 Tax=Zymoseptoria tritici (strain CBS 115943 / IPO323) TaxID=336722 RepID=F9XCY9_ZYMTI|nr:uncharacterized protein MYCGRDRAFT_93766 [Zymoseptoria tritici IPO323]EGP86395.1 hypothetical protein MYCGRDRAFT_93766 [Zymoseptoria tritici IPO323]
MRLASGEAIGDRQDCSVCDGGVSFAFALRCECDVRRRRLMGEDMRAVNRKAASGREECHTPKTPVGKDTPASRSIRVRRPEPAAEEYTHARRISYTPSAACRSRTRSRKRIRCLPLEGDGPSTRGHHLVDRPFPENKSFRPPFRRRASRPSIINTPKVVSIQEQFLTTTAWLVEDLAKDHVGCILHF